MAGGKEVQLSAEVDLLPSEGDRAASRQQGTNKPPISMNFEVCSVCACTRTCVRVCCVHVHACVRVCVRASVRVFACVAYNM